MTQLDRERLLDAEGLLFETIDELMVLDLIERDVSRGNEGSVHLLRAPIVRATEALRQLSGTLGVLVSRALDQLRQPQRWRWHLGEDQPWRRLPRAYYAKRLRARREEATHG